MVSLGLLYVGTETFLLDKVVAVRITRLVFGYNFVVHHFVR
jgi:hypothetical protein